jgi:amino acid transporter
MGLDVIIINLILAIPTFLLCRLILRRIKDKWKRQLSIWLATLTLTPIIYFGLITGWVSFVSYYPERDFDKTKWETDIERRYEMTDDLVKNRKLIGKTKEEIKELLGQEGVSFDGSRWTYYIGFKPSLFGIDPDVLEIEFKEGKVSKSWTRET